MNKEKQNPMYPAEIVSMSFRFSGKALQWLHGTTKDDNGKETGNFSLFNDLLSGMSLASCEGNGFRIPLMLSAGQAQYSEKSFPRGGTWAGNVYATCWPHSQIWD